MDPHKSGWTEGSPETGHACPFPKWEKWHIGKDLHPNKVLSSQQDTEILPIVAGHLYEHVKAPSQDGKSVTESKISITVLRPSLVARRFVSDSGQGELDLREVLGFAWSVSSVDEVQSFLKSE